LPRGIWDLNTRKPEPGKFDASACTFLDFSPDGTRLLASHSDRVLTMWDMESGVRLKEWNHFPGPVQARFAPDGRHIVTKNFNGTAYVLRLRPGG